MNFSQACDSIHKWLQSNHRLFILSNLYTDSAQFPALDFRFISPLCSSPILKKHWQKAKDGRSTHSYRHRKGLDGSSFTQCMMGIYSLATHSYHEVTDLTIRNYNQTGPSNFTQFMIGMCPLATHSYHRCHGLNLS